MAEVLIYTLTVTVWALTVVVPVRAESASGNWQPVNNCSTRKTALGFQNPGSRRLSIDRQCSNGSVTCRYDLSRDLGPFGKCHGYCPSVCPNITNDGDWDPIVIIADLPDRGDTCTLSASAVNPSGDDMSFWAVEVTNDCNSTSDVINDHNTTSDINDGIHQDRRSDACACELAMLSLSIITLVTLELYI